MSLLSKTILLICLTVLSVNAWSNRDLVAVVQLFRHGHRTPVSFYTNDPYSNKSFWNGLDVGQLTNVGKRQHYALGQFTRRRYGGWLPLKYDRDIFYAQTTDVDRTHMSGQSNLYGLYPASRDQRWRRNVDWQPIPLHPSSDSNIFNGAVPSSSCTAYYSELVNVLTEEYFTAIDENYAELYAFLTEKSGDNITSFTGASTIWDCFKSERDYGLALPDWAPAVFQQPLYDIAGYSFQMYSYSTKLQRLALGPYLNSIVEYFEEMAENSTSSQKYMMYSAHDTNIAGVLNSLGAYEKPYPPNFASTIYFELRNKSGNYIVNVWSKNIDDLKPISIKGCAFDCPLSEVRTRLSDILIDTDTWSTECAETSELRNPLAVEKYDSLVKTIQTLKWQNEH